MTSPGAMGTTPSWDRETDVVVLGSGAAGLTAALTAAVNGASVEVYEKAATVGGTSAVSGGIVWIPAHRRMPEEELTAADAMSYLRAQSLGSMDEDLVETFVRTGAVMLDFVEAHSDIQFEIADGFPDYKPELPGGRPGGGRSLAAVPYDLARLGEWADRITSFPADFSNVGIDAETRARIHASVDDPSGQICVAGTALIGGLLKGLLDAGVVLRHKFPCNGAHRRFRRNRRRENRMRRRNRLVRARRGVVLGTGGFEWDESLVDAFLRGPMHGAVSLPTTPATGCGWRWPTVRTWPTWAKRGGCRSSGFRATPSTVSRAAEACGWSAPARGASSSIVPASGSSTRRANTTRWQALSTISIRAAGYVNDPAWIVFDSLHLKRYGFLGVAPGDPVPEWFCRSADFAELGAKTGIDPDGLARTVAAWNRNVANDIDPEFGRGSSAYDGYWGDERAATSPGRRWAHRQRAVLRGAGVRRRDGHEGRPAYRPRRPRPARQRQARYRGFTQRATRWPV